MINKVELIGRIGKEPEVRTFDNGGQIANFTVATTDRVKKGESWEDETDWHNVKAVGGAAKLVAGHLKKGDLVYLSGKLKTRTWEKDGVKKYITEVVSFEIKGLIWGDKKEAPPVNNEPIQEAKSDDLPF